MNPDFVNLMNASAGAPTFAPDAVAQCIEAQFGLVGEYTPLVSERDQNFLLRIASGERFVAKVTSRSETALATDFQIGALQYLEQAAGLLVPRVYRARTGALCGEIADEKSRYRLRVVTWVSGEPLESRGLDTRVVGAFGTALAYLDRAFAAYSHPGENPVLLWDLQRVVELRQLIEYIDQPEVQDGVARALDDFAGRVDPALSALRSQVIHGDANPGNVLLGSGGIGFIDFGDIVKAPLVIDVAIAASYLRSFEADPLALIVPFVAAYHAVMPLENQEAELLFDLIRGRLAATITMLYWRLSARAEDDPYRCKTLALERDAERFLAALDRLGRQQFQNKLKLIQ